MSDQDYLGGELASVLYDRLWIVHKSALVTIREQQDRITTLEQRLLKLEQDLDTALGREGIHG